MKKALLVEIMVFLLASTSWADRLPYTSELIEAADVIGIWRKENIIERDGSLYLGKPDTLLQGNAELLTKEYKCRDRLATVIKDIAEGTCVPRRGLIIFIRVREKAKMYDLVGDFGCLHVDRIHLKVVKEIISQVELTRKWNTFTPDERVRQADLIVSGSIKSGEEHPREYYVLVNDVHRGKCPAERIEILPLREPVTNEEGLFFIQRYYGSGPNYMLMDAVGAGEEDRYLDMLTQLRPVAAKDEPALERPGYTWGEKSATSPADPLRPKADRELTCEEQARVDELVKIIDDKREKPFKRAVAAMLLGEEIAHKSAIPILSALARDGKEHARVKYKAVTALSQIEDKAVMPIIIDALKDKHVDVRLSAMEQLRKLTTNNFGFHPKDTQEGRVAAVEKWKNWWQANKETFEMDRRKALFY